MRLFTVDSFTNKPFSGNPAGVCILDKSLDDDILIKIAAEVNYSETAFVITNSVNGKHSLRWFTPTEEVDLCGHATLATAKVLFEYGYIDKVKLIEFETRSGILTAKLVGDKVELDFPSKKINTSVSDNILESFVNGKPKYVGLDGIWCLIELEDEEVVKEMKPSLNILLKHSQKVFCVTAKSSNPEYDFVSRCFGPAVGINEDPVTGSAHCYLATYWAEKLNKEKLIGFQVSARTGLVECELVANERVLLRGDCVIMSEIVQTWAD